MRGTYANHVAIHQALDAVPLLYERGLGSYELLVLICLAKHLGKDEPTCWVSYPTISSECWFSRDTAIKAMKNLQVHGFVFVAENPGHTNIYRVDFAPLGNSTQ